MAILDHGPISVARYMTLALAHPTEGDDPRHDPLGVAGDFVTAPEVSQLFGELIGLALAQHGRPRPARPRGRRELGPGRGTLMADALRAAMKVVPELGAAMTVASLVETNPTLRERQAAVLTGPAGTLARRAHRAADGRPLLLVANEFLDALPVRQFVRQSGRWHERLIGVDENGAFGFVVAPRPTPFPQVVGGVEGEHPDGTLIELGPTRRSDRRKHRCGAGGPGRLGAAVDYRQRRHPDDRRHFPRGEPPRHRRPFRPRPARSISPPTSVFMASPPAPRPRTRWSTAQLGRANSCAGWGSPSACASCCNAHQCRSARRSRAASTGSWGRMRWASCSR